MSRLLVFQHVAAEPLGTLDGLIRRRGHRIRYVNFEREPASRPDIDRYGGLIVLGGPMNVEDHPHRPHLVTEMRCIERALAQAKPVLGICLGAQLLAHVLGARVYRGERPEIGWYPLRVSEHGHGDPVLAPLGDSGPVFQWHHYGFDLPDGAQHLAGSSDYPNQAIRYGEHAYGFQFHPEVSQALIERWLGNAEYGNELACSGLCRDVAGIRAETAQHIAAMQAAAEQMFGRFLDHLGLPLKSRRLPSREWV